MVKIGLELEILSRDDKYNVKPPKNWKVHGDESIAPAGFEFVLYRPVHHTALLKRKSHIDELCTYIKKNGYGEVNSSCGFHLHYDASELSAKEIYNIYYNFLPLIPQIIRMFNVNASRLDNYCNRNDQDNPYLNYLSPTNIQRWNLKNTYRYMMFNLNSLAKHNSLEFRFFNGTTNKRKIKAYINFITALVARLKKRPLKLIPLENSKQKVVFNFNKLVTGLKLPKSTIRGLFLQMQNYLKDETYVLKKKGKALLIANKTASKPAKKVKRQ
jgi:hypothetical protein